MANKLDQYTEPIDGDTAAEPQNQATPDAIDARAAIVTHKNALERMADYAERFNNMPTAAYCGEDFTPFAKDMQPRGLCFVGGDPGSGKTSFLLNIAAGRIAAGKPTIMLTLEMSAPEILQRLAAIIQNTPAAAIHDLNGLPQYIERLILIEPTDCDADGAAIFDADTLAADVADLRAKCNDLNADIMLIVDSLNMLETSSANDERRAVNINIRALSRFTKANNVTTMCIAQSNRETTKDNAKKYFADFADTRNPAANVYDFTPLLYSFRESSLIEYIADCVFYVLKENADQYDLPTVARQIVAVKHRYKTPNSHVKFDFDRPTFKFFANDNSI